MRKKLTTMLNACLLIALDVSAQIGRPDVFGVYSRVPVDTFPPASLPLPEATNGIASFISSDGTSSSGRMSQDYYDGMGRLKQQVRNGGGNLQQDLVSMKEYDAYGRECRSWLPAAIPSGQHTSYTYDMISTHSQSTNSLDAEPYSYFVYEPSGMQRVVESYGPGADWHSSGKSVKTDYLANKVPSDNSTLACRLINFSFSETSDVPTVYASGYYPSGTLEAVRTTDEDGHEKIEFHNRQGKLILSRIVMGYGSPNFDTYYLYDGWGNLCVVLPPLLCEQMTTGSQSATLVDDLAYAYRYDQLGRMVSKKLPGAEAIYMAYDKADRLVFSQDGEQRTVGKSFFFLYDVFGRECVKGECEKMLDHSGTSSVDNYASCTRADNGGLMGYVASGINLSSPVVFTANYYDDYDFITDDSLCYVQDSNAEMMPPMPKGLLTGMASLLLDGSTVPEYEYQTFYYDEYNRTIQHHATNHIGGYEHYFMEYDFSGNLLHKTHCHTSDYKPYLEENNVYTYDHENRLLTVTHHLNNNTPVMLVDNEYDALGRLIKNNRNGVQGLITEYDYNVRSWLNRVYGSQFDEKIYYNTLPGDATNSACYNGNIASVEWGLGAGVAKAYDYFYDSALRLQQALFRDSTLTSGKDYTVSFDYDANGNVLSLIRKGRYLTDWQTIDDLDLYYSGNQLQKVDKTGQNPLYYSAMYFHDGADRETEYEYDANGCLTRDFNKKILRIEYNALNLPRKIEKNDMPYITYTYTAQGRKLHEYHSIRQVTPSLGGHSLNSVLPNSLVFPGGGAYIPLETDYCDNVVYYRHELIKIFVEGGYITFSGSQPVYHFYEKDHLGSNRLVLSSSGSIEQAIDYYPFGSQTYDMTNPGKQAYKFNGKELVREEDIDLYDFGARWYDPLLGRFTTIDPMCEDYYNTSPYAYCGGDPVNAVDPDGNSIYMLFYTLGNYRGDEMFRAAAETRKYDIENSESFDASKDIVILSPIQDLADLSQLVGNIVNAYSKHFGETSEFSIWSHAGMDGPTGTKHTSNNAIDDKQMSIEGWGNINFNWGQDATANFFGCKTGVRNAGSPSFATRVSSRLNFRGVTVHGQTSSAYPSVYSNIRQNTSNMLNGIFSYPTYMVGGDPLGIIGRFWPTYSPANPMRTSINGKGRVNNYYQLGRSYR